MEKLNSKQVQFALAEAKDAAKKALSLKVTKDKFAVIERADFEGLVYAYKSVFELVISLCSECDKQLSKIEELQLRLKVLKQENKLLKENIVEPDNKDCNGISLIDFKDRPNESIFS